MVNQPRRIAPVDRVSLDLIRILGEDYKFDRRTMQITLEIPQEYLCLPHGASSYIADMIIVPHEIFYEETDLVAPKFDDFRGDQGVVDWELDAGAAREEAVGSPEVGGSNGAGSSSHASGTGFGGVMSSSGEIGPCRDKDGSSSNTTQEVFALFSDTLNQLGKPVVHQLRNGFSKLFQEGGGPAGDVVDDVYDEAGGAPAARGPGPPGAVPRSSRERADSEVATSEGDCDQDLHNIDETRAEKVCSVSATGHEATAAASSSRSVGSASSKEHVNGSFLRRSCSKGGPGAAVASSNADAAPLGAGRETGRTSSSPSIGPTVSPPTSFGPCAAKDAPAPTTPPPNAPPPNPRRQTFYFRNSYYRRFTAVECEYSEFLAWLRLLQHLRQGNWVRREEVQMLHRAVTFVDVDGLCDDIRHLSARVEHFRALTFGHYLPPGSSTSGLSSEPACPISRSLRLAESYCRSMENLFFGIAANQNFELQGLEENRLEYMQPGGQLALGYYADGGAAGGANVDSPIKKRKAGAYARNVVKIYRVGSRLKTSGEGKNDKRSEAGTTERRVEEAVVVEAVVEAAPAPPFFDFSPQTPQREDGKQSLGILPERTSPGIAAAPLLSGAAAIPGEVLNPSFQTPEKRRKGRHGAGGRLPTLLADGSTGVCRLREETTNPLAHPNSQNSTAFSSGSTSQSTTICGSRSSQAMLLASCETASSWNQHDQMVAFSEISSPDIADSIGVRSPDLFEGTLDSPPTTGKKGGLAVDFESPRLGRVATPSWGRRGASSPGRGEVTPLSQRVAASEMLLTTPQRLVSQDHSDEEISSEEIVCFSNEGEPRRDLHSGQTDDQSDVPRGGPPAPSREHVETPDAASRTFSAGAVPSTLAGFLTAVLPEGIQKRMPWKTSGEDSTSSGGDSSDEASSSPRDTVLLEQEASPSEIFERRRTTASDGGAGRRRAADPTASSANKAFYAVTK